MPNELIIRDTRTIRNYLAERFKRTKDERKIKRQIRALEKIQVHKTIEEIQSQLAEDIKEIQEKNTSGKGIGVKPKNQIPRNKQDFVPVIIPDSGGFGPVDPRFMEGIIRAYRRRGLLKR